MEKIKPWLGRYLNSPKIQYIMNFIEFIEVEEVLKDLKTDIIDLDELVDEKKGKKYIRSKVDFEKRKAKVIQAGKDASTRNSGIDNQFIGSTGFKSEFLG